MVINARVRRDAVHPRVEAGFAVESVKRAICTEEDLLSDVVRVLDAVGEVVREFVDAPVMALHKHIKGRIVARLELLDEKDVNILHGVRFPRHGSTRQPNSQTRERVGRFIDADPCAALGFHEEDRESEIGWQTAG